MSGSAISDSALYAQTIVLVQLTEIASATYVAADQDFG